MKRELFRNREYFESADDYKLLPLRFMRWSDGEVVVSNDGGDVAFLKAPEFDDLVSHRLTPGTDVYKELKSKQFLVGSRSSVALELLATKYRTKKSFLEGFTKLHIFVVTLRCEHSCSYCQVSRVTQNKTRYDMTRETAARAVELMFRSPAKDLKVEFQGGEPLLNFDLIRWIVELVKERNIVERRSIEFVVATNLALLSDEMLAFFLAHSVHISTSIDGPAWIHNDSRRRRGNNSYELTVSNMTRARAVLGRDRVAALMTTTTESLKWPIEIVDEYLRLGFDSIFLRPISPYGFATRKGATASYDAEEFLRFYKTALDYIVDLNRRGIAFMEIYTQILLQKILTPFATGYVDLQSPAGAGIGAVVYNYDGDVYVSDEGRMLAEMGDESFRLGTVHEAFDDVFGGTKMQAILESSCHETLPGCSECAFAPYCGADPVFNWTTQGDPVGHRPTSAFCARNMTILRHLFQTIKEGDQFTRQLFVNWAVQQRTDDTKADIT